MEVDEAVEDIAALVTNHNNVLIREDCIILNFGFPAELPFPQVSVTPVDAPFLVLTTHGMMAPNTCSVVLVAGHHLQNIQGVLDMMETMSSTLLSAALPTVESFPANRDDGGHVKFTSSVSVLPLASLVLTLLVTTIHFLWRLCSP